MSNTTPAPDPIPVSSAAGGGTELQLSPFCIHLQSKKLFFLRGPPRVIDDILDASRHCWCRKTMQVVAPDGDVVDPRDCQSGRSCFESIL